MLRFRIGLNAGSVPDPEGFWWPNNENIYSWKNYKLNKKNLIKTLNFVIPRLLKIDQATGEDFGPQYCREHSAL